MKPSYRIGENIRLEIQLANIGHEAFVIRRQLGWGVRRTEIHVFDSNGKEVFTSVLADQLPPPPREHDFIELDPNQFFGVHLEEPITDFVNSPGTYEFVVDYTSHLSEQWARENLKLPPAPLWSSERGTVKSNRVTVVVTK